MSGSAGKNAGQEQGEPWRDDQIFRSNEVRLREDAVEYCAMQYLYVLAWVNLASWLEQGKRVATAIATVCPTPYQLAAPVSGQRTI